MKKILAAAACLVGLALVGCDSSSTSKTKPGQFTGTSAPTVDSATATQTKDPSTADSPVLVPKGAPPEAKKTMEGMMKGAKGMPVGPGGAPSGGGAPQNPPPGGNP